MSLPVLTPDDMKYHPLPSSDVLFFILRLHAPVETETCTPSSAVFSISRRINDEAESRLFARVYQALDVRGMTTQPRAAF